MSNYQVRKIRILIQFGGFHKTELFVLFVRKQTPLVDKNSLFQFKPCSVFL